MRTDQHDGVEMLDRWLIQQPFLLLSSWNILQRI